MSENNPLIQVSMQIILNAGDARTDAFKALEEAKKGDFDAAETKIRTAEEAIKNAHQAQTDVLQAEMGGEEHELCILFIHAQDTLMTIKSELSMIKEMIDLYKTVYSLKG
ncbi:MAG: PTS lactose/cellobiose transporter subunit IIA [Erysipelotrichaceae bacterium]|nr:PTS lactose/cellobiose transporter subunit IIA [Erysipelotrichaceae bacterium]